MLRFALTRSSLGRNSAISRAAHAPRFIVAKDYIKNVHLQNMRETTSCHESMRSDAFRQPNHINQIREHLRMIYKCWGGLSSEMLGV